MKKILITVPNLGWISSVVVLRLLDIFLDPRYKISILLPALVPYENNLSHIRKMFLE